METINDIPKSIFNVDIARREARLAQDKANEWYNSYDNTNGRVAALEN